jgi:ferredoxin-NADP reductase
LRHRKLVGSDLPLRLLYSARSLDDVVYRDELMHASADGADVRFTLTRTRPEGWSGYDRRIDRELIADVAWAPGDRPLVYACGPNGFVEAAAASLVELGHDPRRVRTERFGPS